MKLCFQSLSIFFITGDIISKTNTWPLSNTEKVKMNTNWKIGFSGSRYILRVKVDNKNYNHYFIKHDKDNNSKFKLFSEIKIIKGVPFILKPLTIFKTMSGFPFSNISLVWINCRVFETKPTFPFLSIIRFQNKPHFHI